MQLFKMSDEDYFAMKGVNASLIKEIYRDPELYIYNKKNALKLESKALRLGSLVHCFLLEPEEYKYRYVVGGNSAVTKEFKQAKKDHPDKIVITEPEQKIAMDIVDHNMDVFKFFALTTNENACVGHIEVDGHKVKVKGKLDSIQYNDDGSYSIYDLKTTSDLDWFARDAIKKYYYHLSAGFYSMLMELAKPEMKMNGFYFVAVDTRPPYHSKIFEVSNDLLEKGKDICLDVIKTYLTENQIDDFKRPNFLTTMEKLI